MAVAAAVVVSDLIPCTAASRSGADVEVSAGIIRYGVYGMVLAGALLAATLVR
jgi:hypothetical protein